MAAPTTRPAAAQRRFKCPARPGGGPGGAGRDGAAPAGAAKQRNEHVRAVRPPPLPARGFLGLAGVRVPVAAQPRDPLTPVAARWAPLGPHEMGVRTPRMNPAGREPHPPTAPLPSPPGSRPDAPRLCSPRSRSAARAGTPRPSRSRSQDRSWLRADRGAGPGRVVMRGKLLGAAAPLISKK